jgi:quercetin dioxygenase-like cupin family protein/catechol 2,3-dioxygenase-like lactoylglutathione lyase family enzyme
MTVTSQDRSAIASEPTTSRAWWFLGTLAVLRNPEGSAPVPVVMELTIPPGGSPPEHVHDTLDDSFFLLGGEVVVRCGKETVVARPGSYVVMPHGVPHTFRVTGREPARLLLIHADDSFLRFVEAVGTPAEHRQLPPAGEFDLHVETLARLSAEHGAPMVGEPFGEDEARGFVGDSERTSLGPVNHVSLEVVDVAASERWYAEALGMVRVDGEVNEDGTGHIVLLHPVGGWIITLMSSSAPRVNHVAFTCADRDMLVAWREALAERGIARGDITDAPYGSGFVVRDPDGIERELFVAAPVTQ